MVLRNTTVLMLHASRTCAYALCPTMYSTSYKLILQLPSGKDAAVAQKTFPPECDTSIVERLYYCCTTVLVGHLGHLCRRIAMPLL